MTTPYFTSVLSSQSFDQQYIPSSSNRGRPRGSLKRGRKPRGAGISSSLSPRPFVAPVAEASTSVVGTSGSQQAVPTLDLAGLLSLNPTVTPIYQPPIPSRPVHAPDEDGEGEDELLPAMADDDYSAQLSWQSQSKDNLKYVISLSACQSMVPVITDLRSF